MSWLKPRPTKPWNTFFGFFLCALCVLCGERFSRFNTARRSRNQTSADHTPAGIAPKGDISARLATNPKISSTECRKLRAQRAQRKSENCFFLLSALCALGGNSQPDRKRDNQIGKEGPKYALPGNCARSPRPCFLLSILTNLGTKPATLRHFMALTAFCRIPPTEQGRLRKQIVCLTA